MGFEWEYKKLKEVLRNDQLPAMVVDLNHLDANISNISELVAGFNKKIRIASKSVRVPWLLDYIIKKGGDHFQGLMCFSVPEAEYLSSLGFDDLLIAYPTVSKTDLETFYSLTQKGVNITLMIDCVEHIGFIEQVWRRNGETGLPAKVCIDVDMSWKPAGMHIGAQRSPIRSIKDFKQLFQLIKNAEHLSFTGIMGYEGQIAGMGEKSPYSPMLNPVKKFIKRRSVKDIAKKRKQINDFLLTENVVPEIYNGGGTGSLKSTGKEPWLTEVTAGSGFLQSHLFDYFGANTNTPAICFGLQVTRIPESGIATCKSGGFIASGDVGADKWPIPFLPKGIKMTKNEGFGEVQTPIQIPSDISIKIGDPLFFRPAKAGEIAERFSEYILIRDNTIIEKVPTYRGLGKCFY